MRWRSIQRSILTRFPNAKFVKIHAIFHVQFQSNLTIRNIVRRFYVFALQATIIYYCTILMTCLKILHVWLIACLSKKFVSFSSFRYCLMMSFWSNLNRSFFAGQLYLWKNEEMHLKWSLTLTFSKPLQRCELHKKIWIFVHYVLLDTCWDENLISWYML